MPGKELSREEATQRGQYLKCYYTDQNHLEHAEVIQHTETGEDICRIIYYDRLLPHSRIIRQHQATYPDVPLDIVLLLAPKDDENVRIARHYGADGRPRYTQIAHWHGRHVMEVHKDFQGTTTIISSNAADDGV
jgi:hypothetical protein